MKSCLIPLAFVCALILAPAPVIAAEALASLQERAVRFNSALNLPTFDKTPAEITASLEKTISECNAALDRVGKLSPAEVNFTNTAVALDTADWHASLLANRLNLIRQTSPKSSIRDAASDAVKRFEDWAVGMDYREDVYRALKAYAGTNPQLSGVEAKLLREIMRDYRRAGLDLPAEERAKVEALRKKLAAKSTDFDNNISQATKPIAFTRNQLVGVPKSILAEGGIQTGKEEFTFMANVTWQYLAVMENCRVEATRREMQTARDNLARKENLPLVQEILGLRAEIARQLGYRSWADYQTEIKMARTAAAAIEFEDRLSAGLQPKFDAELAAFRKLKVELTRDPAAKVELWDWRFLANELKKRDYNVDAEQLRIYFPMDRVLDGMFTTYQRIFGVQFQRVTPPYLWVNDLQLFAVSDSATGEPLGCFYLDLFPREGKFNHFAVFPIIEGVRLPGGEYQRPVVALVCNFPPPSPGKPSLLQHDDVETLFHEFGHVMHNILTRAPYAKFSGANVPSDFVEAPSQMLEAWVWDKKVLDSFAADYRHPEKKIPEKILNQLKAAKLSSMGCFFRRQLAYGLLDLALHTQITTANASSASPLANTVLAQTFLAPPQDTAPIAYFGHFVGYDAGYYGYAWAKSIAADMATKFEQSPEGFFDSTAGRRLRDEIYAVGNTRDAEDSVEKFLGRERSLEPFLKEIGVRTTTSSGK